MKNVGIAKAVVSNLLGPTVMQGRPLDKTNPANSQSKVVSTLNLVATNLAGEIFARPTKSLFSPGFLAPYVVPS